MHHEIEQLLVGAGPSVLILKVPGNLGHTAIYLGKVLCRLLEEGTVPGGMLHALVREASHQIAEVRSEPLEGIGLTIDGDPSVPLDDLGGAGDDLGAFHHEVDGALVTRTTQLAVHQVEGYGERLVVRQARGTRRLTICTPVRATFSSVG